MDNISNALKLSLSTNPVDRMNAYNFLEENKYLPNFMNNLVSISLDESILSPEIKQNATIQLKNLVQQNWRTDGKNFVLNDTDKQYLMSNILRMYSCCDNNNIRKHYKQIIKVIIQDQFLKWKDLHHFLASSLISNNKLNILYGIDIFRLLAKHYANEIRKSSLSYDNTITNNYQALTKLMMNLLVEINEDTAQYIRKVLKIFEFSIAKDLPKSFQNTDNFTVWMEFLLVIMRLTLNPELEKPSELDDLSKNILWIIKIQAFMITYKLYQKYGIDFGSTKQVSNISLLVNEKYSKVLLEVNLSVLFTSNQKYLPKEIISLIYMILSQMSRREQFIEVIESNLQRILQDTVKLVLINKAYFDLYQNSPKYYIYNQFEINDDENCYDIRYSISRFLKILCQHKRRDDKGNYINNPVHFQFIYNYYLGLLKAFDDDYIKGLMDVRYKESILFLIQSMKESILMFARESIENNLIPILIKDINDNFGMLRERVCILLRFFCFNDLKNKDTLGTIVQQLCNRLHDSDLPVRIKAAIAIPIYLNISEARSMLIPYLQSILGVYLKLIGEIDIDELLVGLENLVAGFKEDIIQYSTELVKQLVLSYKKCLVSETKIFSNQDSDKNEEKELNNAETSCVKTIVKLFDICVKNTVIYSQLEVEVFEMLKFSLSSEGLPHLKNTHLIFHHIVSKSERISLMTWTFFPRFVQIVSGNELNEYIEIHGKLVEIILFYIVNDPSSFLSGKDEFEQPYINSIMFLVEKLLKNAEINKQNDTSKEEFELCVPIKILVVLLESFKGKMDTFLEYILKLVISELAKSLHIYYKSFLVQVVALSIYNNPELTLTLLDNMNVTANFFELWITILKGMNHDFEMRRTLYGFASILLVEPSKLNPIIKANISSITSEILNLTKKLINEYENKVSNEEAEVSGDENDNPDELEENIADLDDFIEDDEDENEDKEHETLKTSLERQNEFIFLKSVFEFIYNNNQNYYNQLLSTFSKDQSTYLFSVFGKAENLKMKAK